jgi:hypothetical protein
MAEPTITNLAQTAYEAYVEDAGGLNYQGNPCPVWSDLPDDIRRHWKVAIVKALTFWRTETELKFRGQATHAVWLDDAAVWPGAHDEDYPVSPLKGE